MIIILDDAKPVRPVDDRLQTLHAAMSFRELRREGEKLEVAASADAALLMFRARRDT